MYKYYLFKINKIYYKDELYNILDGIRRSSIKDISTTFSLYKNITRIIPPLEKQLIVKYIKDNGNYQYMKNKYQYYDYYDKEKTTIIFHNSYLMIKTNKEDSKVINHILENYNYYLCSFDIGCINDKKTV